MKRTVKSLWQGYAIVIISELESTIITVIRKDRYNYKKISFILAAE